MPNITTMNADQQCTLDSFAADIRRGDADAAHIAVDYLTDQGQELPQIAEALLPAVLQGYAGTPKEFTDGMAKDRLWKWLRRVERVRPAKMFQPDGSWPWRWEAVRDMEIDWNSEIDWQRIRADIHGAPIRLRDLKRRVLALFPDVKWTLGLQLSWDATENLLDRGTTLADFRNYVRLVKTIPPDWANRSGQLTWQLLSKGFWSHLPVQRQELPRGFFFTQRQSGTDIIPPEPQQKDGQQ